MSEWTEREIYYADFEEDGEDETRRKVSAGEWDGKSIAYARDWLSRFDSERADARESLRDEIAASALDEARKANDLAVQANANARTANTIATLAIIIAVVAIAVSIVTAFLNR